MSARATVISSTAHSLTAPSTDGLAARVAAAAEPISDSGRSREAGRDRQKAAMARAWRACWAPITAWAQRSAAQLGEVQCARLELGRQPLHRERGRHVGVHAPPGGQFVQRTPQSVVVEHGGWQRSEHVFDHTGQTMR